MLIETKNLKLILRTPEEVRAEVQAMDAATKTQLQPEWLARLDAAESPDPWIHGFSMIHSQSGEVVGTCGFNCAPVDGVAEIAYGVAPDHQGKGYATEAAAALTQYAFNTGSVRVVCAHTLPETGASTRVLTKCGFRKIGEVMHAQDGLLWRWEKSKEGT